MTRRRHLKLADTDAVVAEVALLRPGYTRAGNWSLPQIAWHLGTAIRFSMRPPPHDPMRFKPIGWLIRTIVVLTGRIPAGRRAPDRVVPQPQVPESAVDEFISALNALKIFPGPFAPHPLVGKMNPKTFMRFHLVHCAHHLGFLSPVKN